MKVRLVDDPNVFVHVDEVEYFRLVRENKVIPPWDPASLTKDDPADLTGHFVTAPDLGRGPRFPFLVRNQEVQDAEGSSDH